MRDRRADNRDALAQRGIGPTQGSRALGRYRLVGSLIEDCAHTWRAVDTSGRTVALRIEPSDAVPKSVVTPAGPWFPRVLDRGTADGLTFIATELFEGEDLARRLVRRGALSVDETLALLRALASALAPLHARGIVHGGIRPDHVFYAKDPDGETIKVLGLENASTSVLRCKPNERAYASPEQLAGRAAIDPKSDVYSTAALLLQCLTGLTPIAASARFGMRHGARDAATGPGSSRARALQELPRVFEPVFRRALAPAVSERTPTMNALAVAFGEAARQVSGTRPALRPSGARPDATATTPTVGVYRPELPTLVGDSRYEALAADASRAPEQAEPAEPAPRAPATLHTLLRAGGGSATKAAPPPPRPVVHDDPRLSIAELDPARLGSIIDASLTEVAAAAIGAAREGAAGAQVDPPCPASPGAVQAAPVSAAAAMGVGAEPPAAMGGGAMPAAVMPAATPAAVRPAATTPAATTPAAVMPAAARPAPPRASAAPPRIVTLRPAPPLATARAAEEKRGVDLVAVIIVVATCLAFLGVLAVLFTSR